jgi:HPt (histidine-containing phosphotransfer) domain-containing protein
MRNAIKVSTSVGSFLAFQKLTFLEEHTRQQMKNDSPHVSRARLDEIGMGDPEFTIELIDMMLEDGLKRVEDMARAFAEHRSTDVGRLAHSLKGACLNIGALELASLCASIDETVRKLNETLDSNAVTQVSEEFHAVAEELVQIKRELAS